MAGKSKKRSKVLQMLGSWPPQMGVSKYKSKKREGNRGEGSTCGQATKGIAREKAGMSHMGKDIGVLQ